MNTSTTLQSTIVYPSLHDQEQVQYTPHNTVFMFDVDGVLITRGFLNNWRQYVRIWWESGHRIELLGLVFWAAWNYNSLEKMHSVLPNDVFLDRMAEQCSVLQQKANSGKTIVEEIQEAASQGTPHPHMIQVLLQLFKEGYPIVIATNQGQKTFERLMRAGTVPDASHYTLIYTQDIKGDGTYVHKPHADYYLYLQQLLAKKGFGTYYKILVDDRLRNIQGATTEGIIGIHLNARKTVTSAKEFCNDLQKLNILGRRDERREVPDKHPFIAPFVHHMI